MYLLLLLKIYISEQHHWDGLVLNAIPNSQCPLPWLKQPLLSALWTANLLAVEPDQQIMGCLAVLHLPQLCTSYLFDILVPSPGCPS